ncbi:hypothetical protein PCE1_000940 [Barthelona sp. PCE]
MSHIDTFFSFLSFLSLKIGMTSEELQNVVHNDNDTVIDDNDKLTKVHITLMILLFVSAILIMSLEIAVTPILPMLSQTFSQSGYGNLLEFMLSLMVSGPLVASASTNTVLSAMGDQKFGTKTMSVVTLFIYSFASLLIPVFSDNLWAIIILRVISGIGMAALSLMMSLAITVFPDKYGKIVIGILSLAFSLGAAIGMIISAWLVDIFSWTTMFTIQSSILLFVVVLLVFLLPPTPIEDKDKVSIDYGGGSLIFLFLGGLLTYIIFGNDYGYTHYGPISGLVISFLSLIGFIVVEQRVENPIIAFDLLKESDLIATCIIAVFSGFAMFTSFFVLPFLLASFGVTNIMDIALTMVFSSFLQPIGSAVATVVVSKGANPLNVVSFGMAGVAGSFALMGGWHATEWTLRVELLINGLMLSIIMIAMMNVVFGSAARIEKITGKPVKTVALAMNTVARTVGGSVAAPIATLILKNWAFEVPVAPGISIEQYEDEGYSFLFFFAACIDLVACLLAVFLRPKYIKCMPDYKKMAEEMETDVEDHAASALVASSDEELLAVPEPSPCLENSDCDVNVGPISVGEIGEIVQEVAQTVKAVAEAVEAPEAVVEAAEVVIEVAEKAEEIVAEVVEVAEKAEEIVAEVVEVSEKAEEVSERIEEVAAETVEQISEVVGNVTNGISFKVGSGSISFGL